MYFDNFPDALNEFRLSGGAMCFTLSDDGPNWETTYPEELQDRNINAKAATEKALREGGLSEEQVTAELANWQA